MLGKCSEIFYQFRFTCFYHNEIIALKNINEKITRNSSIDEGLVEVAFLHHLSLIICEHCASHDLSTSSRAQKILPRNIRKAFACSIRGRKFNAILMSNFLHTISWIIIWLIDNLHDSFHSFLSLSLSGLEMKECHCLKRTSFNISCTFGISVASKSYIHITVRVSERIYCSAEDDLITFCARRLSS